jgi:SSS family solute:Na+ symporter
LLIGVAAGFLALYLLSAGLPFDIWSPPKIAWPWFVVIGGGINVIVSLAASLLTTGRQREWHPYSVAGQRLRFAREGLAERDCEGWYVVPGRIDRALWGLPVLFVGIMLFLIAFGSLG